MDDGLALIDFVVGVKCPECGTKDGHAWELTRWGGIEIDCKCGFMLQGVVTLKARIQGTGKIATAYRENSKMAEEIVNSDYAKLAERADRESKLAVTLATELAKHDGGKFHSSLSFDENKNEWTTEQF